MSKSSRVWIGMTILAVILLNYLSLGLPLYKRIGSLDNSIKTFAKRSEDAYIVDVLKRETVNISKKIVVLNCVAASAAVIILSWVMFGLIVRREDRRKL